MQELVELLEKPFIGPFYAIHFILFELYLAIRSLWMPHFLKIIQNKPKVIKASHIVSSSRKESEQIKTNLDNGSEVEQLAKEDSTCPSSLISGNMNNGKTFGNDLMTPEINPALFDDWVVVGHM